MVTTIGLVGHVAGLIGQHHWNTQREWRDEVEAGLETMEVLVAVVEPGFKESDWCAQEVGYALGRKVDVIPLRAGLNPFGFFGKYQGVQIKGRTPEQVASDITQIILKKPQHREKVIQCMSIAFSTLTSEKKIEHINMLDDWSILTDVQLKTVIEQASMSTAEKLKLKNLIGRVGAFKVTEAKASSFDDEDDIPF